MNLKPFTLNWSPLFSARSNTLLSEGSIKFELTLPREGEAPRPEEHSHTVVAGPY